MTKKRAAAKRKRAGAKKRAAAKRKRAGAKMRVLRKKSRRPRLTRMEYVKSIPPFGIPFLDVSSELEEMGISIQKKLRYNTKQEILKRVSKFNKRDDRSLLKNLFLLLSCSNALKDNIATFTTDQLPSTKVVFSFEKNLLLLRFDKLAEVLMPAQYSNIFFIIEMLEDRTIKILSQLAEVYPKTSLENYLFQYLKERFSSNSLSKFIEFCRIIAKSIKQAEELAKKEEVYDEYIKSYSKYLLKV